MAKSLLQSVLDRVLGETIQLGLGGNEQPAQVEEVAGVIQLNLTAPERGAPAAAAGAVSRDTAAISALSKADMGSGIAVIDLGGTGTYANLLRKSNVEMLRNYARHSTWVRAAIDYHRRMLGRSVYALTPIDSTEKPSRLDKRVKKAVEDLLRHPNAADESYGLLKEQMVEDYLVVGHGCIELDLNRDLSVRSMRVMDAALIGFVKAWDGTDRSVPRFVKFKDKFGGTIERYLAHEQMFCLVNRPQSDTKLGFSHVEALHRSVLALLAGDDFLIKQMVQPIPDSLINLGEGVTKQQVDEFRYQIQQVRDKLAIVGGVKNAQAIRLSASAEEMKILDGQEWFVRQVAAIFGISTAKLKLAVDTSRANTKEMYDDDLEAITGELVRIQELETATFINRYSYLGDINLEFSYPIMHRKDERQQAQIAKTQTGQAWASINEARTRTGEKPLEENAFPYVNEPIINDKDGPLPYSIWAKKVQDIEKNIGKEPAAPSAEPAPSADGTNGDSNSSSSAAAE